MSASDHNTVEAESLTELKGNKMERFKGIEKAMQLIQSARRANVDNAVVWGFLDDAHMYLSKQLLDEWNSIIGKDLPVKSEVL